MYVSTVFLLRVCGISLPAAALGAAMGVTSSNVFVLAAFDHYRSGSLGCHWRLRVWC